jgi:hypothetical protein
MRFNLRTLLVTQAFLAVSFVEFATAFAKHSDFLAFLIGTLILAPLIGVGLAAACGICGRTRKLLILGFAVLVGILAGSFFAIQTEWHGDGPFSGHPWPESDVLYIVLALVRGGLLGGVVGYVVLTTLSIAAGSDGNDATSKARPAALETEPPLGAARFFLLHRIASPLNAKCLMMAGTIISLLVLSWWPYYSFHQKQRAVTNLLNAIDDGNIERVREQVSLVKRVNGGKDAMGVVTFRATEGRDKHVRMAALQAMKLLEVQTRDVVVTLNIMKQRESDAGVLTTVDD